MDIFFWSIFSVYYNAYKTSENRLKYAIKLIRVKNDNYFIKTMFYNIKTRYLCIVFFMVLDLRLIEDWVVVRQPFFF